MSNKNRTRKNPTARATGTAATLRAVPDQDTAANGRTSTEDKLWKALHAHPNSTATDLANAATIGKSTAGKILAKWNKDGSVTRTPGIATGGRRAADLWAITYPDPNTDTDTDTDTTGDTEPTEQTSPDTDSSDSARPDSTIPDPTEPTATEPTDTEPTDTEPTDTETKVGSVVTEATKPIDDGAATEGIAAEDSRNGKKARLAPGALRGLVEDYLREHPGEHGAHAIAKALGGKSAGAVSNALDALVDAGTAVRTKESPKRFALAPSE